MNGEPICPHDYHELVQVADPRLSPDGETVAFIRTVPDSDEDYETTVYTVSVTGGEPQQFTAEAGRDGEPRWSPTGDRLAFTSTRQGSDQPQLRILPAAGGESRQITAVPGGVHDIRWSPDGTRIAFTQSVTRQEREEGHDLEAPQEYERDRPDPRVIDRMIYRAREEGYFDGKRSHVYEVELETEAVTRITAGDRDFVSPVWGDEQTLHYAVKRGPEPDDSVEFDIEAYDLDSETAETVTSTTAWTPLLAATTDGRIAYTFTPEERMSMRQTEVNVYDRETEETITVTETIDRTVGSPFVEAGLQWGPDEEFIYFLTPDEGNVPLRRARGTGQPVPSIEAVVESGTISGYSVGADRVAFTRSEWDHRGDVFVDTRLVAAGDENGVRRLTNVNADYLAEHTIGEPEEVHFESNGREIQGWMLTPPNFDGDGDKEYPLVVEIHGGPHAMWTPSGTMWHEFQTLAAAGYVVFWSNPRGSTGYGEEFAMAIDRDWGDVTMVDVMAGVETVAKRDGIDGDDVFLTGGSFGGFMTAWIVGQTDRFQAAVAQRGVYDLTSFYGSTDAFKLVEGDFETVPWEEPLFLWEHSPVSRPDAVETPTLVLHADDDYRVPVNNAEMLYVFFRKNGVDTRLVRYPREGHELSRSGEPAHVVDRLERIVRWFDGYSVHYDDPPALERDPAEGLSSTIGDGSNESENGENRR